MAGIYGIYDKWDVPEPEEIAFEKVKTGEWDFVRFQAWCSQVQVSAYHDLMYS